MCNSTSARGVSYFLVPFLGKNNVIVNILFCNLIFNFTVQYKNFCMQFEYLPMLVYRILLYYFSRSIIYPVDWNCFFICKMEIVILIGLLWKLSKNHTKNSNWGWFVLNLSMSYYYYIIIIIVKSWNQLLH